MKLDVFKQLMKDYGLKPLAKKAGVSRTSLYHLLQGENFESRTFEKISKILNVELQVVNAPTSLDETFHHLGGWGAPIAFNPAKPLRLSLEETLKWGLFYSKNDGLLESLMPFFIFIHFKEMNLARALTLLDHENQLQLFGYYLELAYEYSGQKKLFEVASSFYQVNFLPLCMGLEKPSQRMLDVLQLKNNKLAQKWNILTLNTVDDYFQRFKKWEKVV